MYLRITWNANNRIGCFAETNFANPGGFAAGATIPLVNLTLTIYTQANSLIEQMTKQQWMQQQEIIIPEIQWTALWFNQSTSSQSSVKVISNSNKASLYKTYCVIMQLDAPGRINNSYNMNGTTTYTYCRLYVNWNLILDLDPTKLQDYKHLTTQHKAHSFCSLGFWYEISPIVNIYDASPVDDEPIYKNEMKGLPFDNSGNEILINHQFTTTNTALTHYVFAILLKAIYILNGEVSLVPFVN